MVSRGELFHNRTFGEGHIVLIGGYDMVGIFLCRLLDHGEERRGHLFTVYHERTAEYLVAAMFGVNLGKPEHFGVGQLTSELLLHTVQILYLGRREGKSLLLVIGFEVADMLNGCGLDVNGKDALIQAVVHALQHGVVIGLVVLDGEILLNTRNAVEIHVLGNLYGIGAPRSNHFTARTDIPALKLSGAIERGFSVKPAKFLYLVLRKLVVHLSGYHAFLRSVEKQYHNVCMG